MTNQDKDQLLNSTSSASTATDTTTSVTENSVNSSETPTQEEKLIETNENTKVFEQSGSFADSVRMMQEWIRSRKAKSDLPKKDELIWEDAALPARKVREVANQEPEATPAEVLAKAQKLAAVDQLANIFKLEKEQAEELIEENENEQVIFTEIK